MARTGRKRRQNVKRDRRGRIVYDDDTWRPRNMDDIVETGDRGKRYLKRKSHMEKLGFNAREVSAGEELMRLWELTRVHWMDAPPITPKTQSFDSSISHEPSEVPAKVISLGRKVHWHYNQAIKAVVEGHGRRGVRAAVALCIDGDTPVDLGLAHEVMRTLIRHFGL